MCGRFTLTARTEKLKEFFPLCDFPEITPRYNIAPTQKVLAVRQREACGAEALELRWGLIPSWARDTKLAATMINARCDSVADKPAFRAAFKKRRCLVLADGFYEWKKGESKKAPKQPYHIRMRDFRPFAFAGLWEFWKGPDAAEPIESCTILTTDANDIVRPLHDRMPVILDPRDHARWIDPTPRDPAELLEMLRPCSPADMLAVPVSTTVNNARNEGPECLAELRTGGLIPPC